jgi:hypothetical protein
MPRICAQNRVAAYPRETPIIFVLLYLMNNRPDIHGLPRPVKPSPTREERLDSAPTPSLYFPPSGAGVAQSVEQRIRNAQVIGSSPITSSILPPPNRSADGAPTDGGRGPGWPAGTRPDKCTFRRPASGEARRLNPARSLPDASRSPVARLSIYTRGRGGELT